MSCINDSDRTGKFRLKDVTNDPIIPTVDLRKHLKYVDQNKVRCSSSTKKDQITHSMFYRGRSRLMFHDNPQYHFSIKNVAINSVHTPSFFSRFAPTINNMKWRYILLLFFAGIIGSWFFFALIYWMISSFDLKHFNKLGLDGMNCLINVTDFPSALLYSMELQSTIGFGYRYVNSKCWYGVVVSILHAAFGTIFQAVLLMTILNKLTRPVLQNKSVVFSDKVVLYKDKESSIESPDSAHRSSDIWILKFRIGNVNNLSNLLNYNITTQLVIPTVRKSELESQVILRTHDLKVSTLSRNKDSSVLNWPTEIVHYVDEKSPFKRYTTYIERLEETDRAALTRRSIVALKIQPDVEQLPIFEEFDSNPSRLQSSVDPKLRLANSELESFENGQLIVLFTAISSSNGDFVCSEKNYKLSTQLKVDYNFTPMLYFKHKDKGSKIKIRWDYFNHLYCLSNHQQLNENDDQYNFAKKQKSASKNSSKKDDKGVGDNDDSNYPNTTNNGANNQADRRRIGPKMPRNLVTLVSIENN